MRTWKLSILAGLLMLAAPAAAENKVPSPQLQEMLIKGALMTLNDANLTGNYSVLHARLSKPFRDQFTPEKLKEVFKSFADQKADWAVITTLRPVPAADSSIDKRGALQMRGYFDSTPSRVNYDLDFIPSEGEWKPLKLNIDVNPPKDTKDPPK
jgi:hypothetical protein